VRPRRFDDLHRTAFVQSSCRYGLMKYSIIEQGCTARLLATDTKMTDKDHKERIAAAVAAGDSLWKQWRVIAAGDPFSDAGTAPGVRFEVLSARPCGCRGFAS
jgi:hypothetical protein